TGLFDERFRDACEDQDLGHRASSLGIRFIYNDAITCLHNDQSRNLTRASRAQRRGAHDGVFFCAKYPTIHRRAGIAIVNGYVSRGDRPRLIFKKLAKQVLATEQSLWLLERVIAICERWQMPDAVMRRLYRLVLGLNIFRGWRSGLKTLEHGGFRRE